MPGLVFVIWLHRREKGQLTPRQSSLAPLLRILMDLIGALMAVMGVGLILLPTTVAGIWAWSLTPLTGRMIGAWFTAIAVSLVAGTLDKDYPRIYIGAVAYIAFAILQFVNLARYPTSVDWSRPNTWLLVVILVSLLVIGVATLRGFLTLQRVSPEGARNGQPDLAMPVPSRSTRVIPTYDSTLRRYSLS